LGEDELVVFCGEGGHHEAEDVGDCAAEEQPSGAVGVEEASKLCFG
jgi:hypothetical protein